MDIWEEASQIFPHTTIESEVLYTRIVDAKHKFRDAVTLFGVSLYLFKTDKLFLMYLSTEEYSKISIFLHNDEEYVYPFKNKFPACQILKSGDEITELWIADTKEVVMPLLEEVLGEPREVSLKRLYNELVKSE